MIAWLFSVVGSTSSISDHWMYLLIENLYIKATFILILSHFSPPSCSSISLTPSLSLTKPSPPHTRYFARPAATGPRPLPPLHPMSSPLQMWLRRGRDGVARRCGGAAAFAGGTATAARDVLTQSTAAVVAARRPRAQDASAARQPRVRGSATGQHGHVRAIVPRNTTRHG